MLVYQPPLRTSFYNTSKFLRSEKESNDTDNFVHITRRGKTKIDFIVNKDKVSNTAKYKDGKASVIPVEDQKLIEIIDYSFNTYKRTYVFEAKDKPVTTMTLLRG